MVKIFVLKSVFFGPAASIVHDRNVEMLGEEEMRRNSLSAGVLGPLQASKPQGKTVFGLMAL